MLDSAVDADSDAEVFLEQRVSGGSEANVTSRIERTRNASLLQASGRATAQEGGLALSELELRNEVGDVNATSFALGRSGSDARSSIRAVTAADGASVRAGDISFLSGATGGDGSASVPALRDGGDAVDAVDAIAEADAAATARANATGGEGSAIDGRGGDASATARASNEGSQTVFAQATARGGSGATAGDATASAFGSSVTGDVTATASQTGGDGATGAASLLTNAAQGETAGRLVLEQRAEGGRGTETGGAASSTLDVEHGGDGLRISSTAIGGFGADDQAAAMAFARGVSAGAVESALTREALRRSGSRLASPRPVTA